MNTLHCDHRALAAAGVDIGARRTVNQDEVICCPEAGFFAVADGMGGLRSGGETSAMLQKVMPGIIREAAEALQRDNRPERAAELLAETLRMVSDTIYASANRDGYTSHGSTLCGVWLVGQCAVFVNLGDSRGYWLGYYKKRLRQVTRDHNVAQELVENGEITKDEAQGHPASSRLTRFVGMPIPALPETYVQPVARGDRILLCSDGLYGMVRDARLARLLRASRSPSRVIRQLVDEANAAGGADNIAAVYIKITGSD